MRVAAVLVTHNRPQLLQQALSALRAQTRPLDAIYVVDNASEPPCDAATLRLGQEEARPAWLLRADTNLGGAGGFALGMARAFAAGYDWIWLLDDDALARPDALARLLQAEARLRDHAARLPDDAAAAMDTRASASTSDNFSSTSSGSSGSGISSISASGGGGATTSASTSAYTGTSPHPGALCGAVREFGDLALRHRRRYHLPTGIERVLPRSAYAGPPCRIDTASFVGFLVSAAAIAEIGMPERAFFLGYDDTDYSLRLGRAGLSLWLVPDSVIEHVRARRARLRAGPFGPKHYFTIRNRIAVARRHATLPVLPTVVALLFGVALWLVCTARPRRGARRGLHRGSLRILLHAMVDGCQRRLGPFPAALARLQGPPASAQVSAGTDPGRA